MTVERLGYRPGLDGLRGVAIAAVLVAHSPLEILPGANIVGVDLFFVLSGFLITTLLLEERGRGPVNLPAFYLRRVRRLMPALVAFVAAVVVVGAVTNASWASRSTRAAPYALLYVMNVARIEGVDPGILSHTWSLSVEEHFYLLWPALMLVLLAGGVSRRRMVWILGGLACLSAALQFGGTSGDWWFGTHTRGGAMLVGCAAAVAWTHGWRVTGRLIPAGVLLALAFVDSTGPVFPSGGSLIGWCAAALLVLATVEHRWRGGPLMWVGKVSYGIYLWHRLVYALVEDLPIGNVYALVAVEVALSLAVAACSYRWIESPFLARRATPAPTA